MTGAAFEDQLFVLGLLGDMMLDPLGRSVFPS